MKSNWEEAKLDTVYEFRSGLSKPRSEFGYGYSFLSFKDVFYNYFVPEELVELVNSSERERDHCSIKRGDVFLTRTSETMEDLGVSCVALGDHVNATFNGFTKRLRPLDHSRIVPEYAGYYFRSPKFRRDVTAMSSLSTRASLNNDMLSRLKIVLPSIKEQAAIGNVLKSLDDKIELNRRMNATLEAMAQAILKSWFVDFDPVRAKAEGKQPYGMDEETAALFPDRLVDSGTELGMIPEGWEVKALGDELYVAIGGDWGEESQFMDGTQGYCLRGVDLHDLRANGSAKPPLRWFKKSSLSKREMSSNDIIIATSGAGPVAKSLWVAPNLLDQFDCPVTYSNFCKRLTAKNRSSAIYIDRILFNLRQSGAYEDYVTGTSVPNLDMAGLLRKNALFPPGDVLERFEQIVEPTAQSLYSKQSQTLASLRDTLLPRLMSGEVRVKEAEEMVEEEA